MANPRKKSQPIEFRPATPKDAKIASRLLFETFPQKATFIIGLGSQERSKKILEKIFPIEGHRLSFQFTEIALIDGKVVGLMTSFPGIMKGKLDRKLDGAILRQYHLRGKLAVISRGLPLVFIKEAARDEYFLNNLAVRQGKRNQGIGREILLHFESKAKQAEYKKVSLIVHAENKGARRFYNQNGYDFRALHLESNKRVPHLGAGYQRMTKILTK